MLTRLGLAVAAVVVLAWTGVLVRDTRLAARAGDPAAPHAASGRAAARAAERLRSARLLNPDSGLDVARARYEVRAGRPRAGLALAESVVRSEPENIDGWVAVWAASGALRDRPRIERAVAEIRRLDPFAGR